MPGKGAAQMLGVMRWRCNFHFSGTHSSQCSDEANIGSRGGRALPRLEGEALKKGFLEEVISQDLAEW
jgi:hypothetical protein